MKRGCFLAVVIIGVVVPYTVGSLPAGTAFEKGVYMPHNWYARETSQCPYGYACRYEMWVPSITFSTPVWVFGVSNKEERGGTINFREYPDSPCTQNCVDDVPVLYTAEVIYVPSWDGNYSPEDVPLTYIPKGRYVVTSPSFSMCYNVKIWSFHDNGSGPKRMSAYLVPDKLEYGREDSHVIFSLQITDQETGEYIQVDTIKGVIVLPDSTEKTVTTEDWAWNSEKELYEYNWNFTNDEGACSDPKEGSYSADMYVKKRYYEDVWASTRVGVCYHIEIDLVFDKEIPEYSLGESVGMTVYVTDEHGSPLDVGLESVLILPDGTEITNLAWESEDSGIYSATYQPEQEGEYHITVGVQEDIICYLEETSATFYVTECEKAVVYLEISSNPTVEESVEFVLTVTDDDGNLLSGAEIESELYLNGDFIATLSWADQGDGTYTTEYTPSSIGLYSLCGRVTIFKETDCYKGLFDGYFTVTEKKWPDLVIRNEDITVYPEPVMGDTVLISVTVQNVGNADAEEFWVVILINDEVMYKEFVECLAAGEHIVIEYQWTVLYTGGYIIQAIADPPEGLA